MYLHYYGKRPETLNGYFEINDSIYTPIILGQLQKEQITENFLLSIEEQ